MGKVRGWILCFAICGGTYMSGRVLALVWPEGAEVAMFWAGMAYVRISRRYRL